MKPVSERQPKFSASGYCTEHPSVPGPLRRDVEKVARRALKEREQEELRAKAKRPAP